MKLSPLAREMCDEMAELAIIDAHSHLRERLPFGTGIEFREALR